MDTIHALCRCGFKNPVKIKDANSSGSFACGKCRLPHQHVGCVVWSLPSPEAKGRNQQ